MQEINHQDMVKTLGKSGEEILASLSPERFHALRMILQEGIDAGNKLDAAKKLVIYNKEGEMPQATAPRTLPEYSARAFHYLTPERCHLLHMALGVFGEAAELLENIYGHVYKCEPFDQANAKEESGDIEFYHEGLRQGAGFSREDALRANIEKLGERYRGFQYSDQAAQARADKA